MRQESRGFVGVGVLVFSFLLLVFSLETASGAEEKFPTRSLTVIVSASPGGGNDIVARIIAEAVEPILGQKVVVINKAGGTGTIGLSALANAKPDGYTFGVIWNAPLTIVPHMMQVSYSLDDFVFLTNVAVAGMPFCVLNDFPAKNAEEFFEYLRKNPEKFTFGTDGIGGTVHFSGVKVFKAFGVKVRAIPYRGASEILKALLGGHIDIYHGSVSTALPHVKAGKIRALLISTPKGIEELPGVPGVGDLGHPEAATVTWRGFIGPKGIPPERVAILEKALRQAAQTEKVVEYLKKLGQKVVATPGKEYEELVRSEFAAHAAIVQELGLAKK